MNFGRLVDNLCDRFTIARNDASRVALKDKVNLIYKEIGNISNVNWEWLRRSGEIVTIPNYTDGTCTISQDSRTVTFVGAVITASMLGRYFQPSGSAYWYKIIKIVDSSTIRLLSPIAEGSQAGISYKIWKRVYYFPSEVRKILSVESWLTGLDLEEKTRAQIQSCQLISTTGEPEEFSLYGIDSVATEYSEGTISLTENSNIATGTGTAWLDNIGPGDVILTSGGQQLRVKTVDSDTTLILLNYATSTAEQNTYTARRELNLGIQFNFNPNKRIVLPYTYQKRVYDMVNDEYDRPELPEEFDIALLDGAEAMRLKELDDKRWVSQITVYAARVTDIKANRFPSQPKVRQFSPRIKSRGGYL